jgi:aminopeptidase N
VQGNELSNQLLTATINGFMTGPAELLEPYVEPYFECLRDAWDGRSIEIASRIVRGLYPLAQDLPLGMDPANHPVVRRTDQWLIEQRSHLLRALNAQATGSPAA